MTIRVKWNAHTLAMKYMMWGVNARDWLQNIPLSEIPPDDVLFKARDMIREKFSSAAANDFSEWIDQIRVMRGAEDTSKKFMAVFVDDSSSVANVTTIGTRSEIEKKVRADVSFFPLGKIYIVEVCATVVITQNVEFKDFQSKD